MAKKRHLTDLERLEIEHGLRHSLSLKKIAAKIGKHHSTIAREICARSVASDKGAFGRVTNRCASRGCSSSDCSKPASPSMWPSRGTQATAWTAPKICKQSAHSCEEKNIYESDSGP